MFCDSCKINKLVSDFIISKNICYKCMYRQKLEMVGEIRTLNKLRCRTCGNAIINKKNQKKRQRTVFCSCECAKKGHKFQIDNHWTRRVGHNIEVKSGK